jgi:site-specific DNA-cytosine methylase
MTTREYTVYCPFGGGGGGALGVVDRVESLFGQRARFKLLGGFDFDAYACKAFEYLTGVPELCRDAWVMTPEDLRRDAGEEAPDFVLSSAPCVAASQLVSPKKAASAPYVKINSLIGHCTRLILDAWPKRPPKILLYENVPNLDNRAREVVEGVVRDLVGADYAVHKGVHQCRTTGDLAQNRLRFFLVARHMPQVPHFMYRPPKKRGKVCGDVITPLPLPGDPAGGPMHQLPNIATVNWLRLALIPTRGTMRPDGKPAKGDWRDLRVMLDAQVGAVQALDLDREKKPQNNVFKVAGFDQPTGAVTSAQSPGNGAVSAADPRPFGHVDRVFGMGEAVGTGPQGVKSLVVTITPLSLT